MNSIRLIAGLLALCAAAAPGWAQNSVIIDGDFSDWADEVCFADDACSDFGGQRDMTGVCIASNFASTDPSPATTVYLRFDFDITTIAGNNSVDGCWLVDGNQNGFVDRGLCFSLNGTGVGDLLELDTTRFFTCNDSSASTCAGQAEVMGSAADCAVNAAITGLDLFPVCTAPDTAIECSVPLSELNWTGGVVALIQGCSSTSSQPNSSTFDCIGPLSIDPETGTNLPVELLRFTID